MSLYRSASNVCPLVETFATSVPSHWFPELDVLAASGIRLTEAVTERLPVALVCKEAM